MQTLLKRLLGQIETSPNALLFLTDFDGTTANIVPIADKAYINPQARVQLGLFADAVLYVTGRSISLLDKLVNHGHDKTEHLYFNVIAEHGLTQRIHQQCSTLLTQTLEESVFASKQRAEQFVQQLMKTFHLNEVSFVDNDNQPQTVQQMHLLETSKSGSIALHWRVLKEAVDNKPDPKRLTKIRSEMHAFLEDEAEQLDHFTILDGHCVYELKYNQINKGRAIESVLNTHFKDKQILIWACDDLAGTDGDAAEVIHHYGGIVIQVLNPQKLEPYTDPAYPNRHPDLIVESPAALAEILCQIRVAYQCGINNDKINEQEAQPKAALAK